MFGYVLPLTAELKVREWHAYRAYYCGLCKELKREYGFLSRFLLNYDLVLPALLADGMAGTQARMCPERCMANPVEKRPMCQSTAGLALAADALVLTVYYKLADDLADERFFKRLPALVLWPFLSRMRKKAARLWPTTCWSRGPARRSWTTSSFSACRRASHWPGKSARSPGTAHKAVRGT